MALWLVTASWSDDEAELTQQWEVNVPTKTKRSERSSMLLPSKPQHVEAKLLSQDVASDLGPGQARMLQ